MSDMKHTPEPWVVERPSSRCGWAVWAPLSKTASIQVAETGYAITFDQANARRIVACVNALEGIPNEALEGWPGMMGQQHMMQAEEIARLTAEVEYHKGQAGFWGRTASEQGRKLETAEAEVEKAKQLNTEWGYRYSQLEAEVVRLRELLSEATDQLEAMNSSASHAVSWVEPRTNTTTERVAKYRNALATRQG